jgi:glycosyltransferase involved in cell wall biosynthesis
VGSAETIEIAYRHKATDIHIIKTDNKNISKDHTSLLNLFTHITRRTFKGLRCIKNNKQIVNNLDFVYSVSDFLPDLLPSFYTKLINSNVKLIVGYYLFAPFPFSKSSPYKGKNRLRGFLYWLIQRPTYFLVKHFADFVFVTSEPDVKKFITKKRDKSRIVVVQGGVNITESEKYLQSSNFRPIKERRYDSCFVGRFHYQKGVLELIDIWNLVCKKKMNAKLAIVGIGPLEKDIRAKIKKYNLENNIELLGFKDGSEKYEIFKQSKIVVHPATYDSGGMAAAEGMAWGLPGVSFDLEALKTYYPKGMVKTEINNIEQFAENIMELLDNMEYHTKISKEARDLIVEVWDWNKRAENIYNWISSTPIG